MIKTTENEIINSPALADAKTIGLFHELFRHDEKIKLFRACLVFILKALLSATSEVNVIPLDLIVFSPVSSETASSPKKIIS